MFLIRQSMPDDIGTLLKLARMVYFINLPPDERLIASKVQQSRSSFQRAASGERTRKPTSRAKQGGITGLANHDSDVFMFTIVDVDATGGGVVGTSQVRARMGGPGNPNYSLKVFHREFRSSTLGIGTTHTLARLHADESGPSEVGGLIIQPAFRGHRERPGRFLSFVRFHFMGLFPELFPDRIVAEMAPQVSSDGDNAFWDAIGRKFIPVRYAEADRFCQQNRKFIDELFPKDDIYLTLLPLEVLNQVGQVGPETAPARRMLEKVGFEYRNFIDPFDGGPHLEAKVERVPMIRDTRWSEFGEPIEESSATHRMIVSVLHEDGEFRAIECPGSFDKQKRPCVIGRAMELLESTRGAECGVTPVESIKPTAKKKRKKAESAKA